MRRLNGYQEHSWLPGTFFSRYQYNSSPPLQPEVSSSLHVSATLAWTANGKMRKSTACKCQETSTGQEEAIGVSGKSFTNPSFPISKSLRLSSDAKSSDVESQCSVWSLLLCQKLWKLGIPIIVVLFKNNHAVAFVCVSWSYEGKYRF